MPLAWLLGQDDDPLYGLASGVLEPQHVCLVGVRSYEPEEDERLRRLGVRVVFMDEIASRGIDAVLDEALDIVTAGTDGFGVSIDLDVVTPEEAPNVGTPAKGGVSSAELARALERIPLRPGLAAVELVEYSPRLDRDGRTARVAIELLAAALCGPRHDAQVLAEAIQR
jgi:arginase